MADVPSLYTDIRRRAESLWRSAENYDKALRHKDDGQGLYLHQSNRFSGWSRIGHGAADRHEKHNNAANLVREGINNEFGWIHPKIGDQIFHRLQQHGKLDAGNMRMDSKTLQEVDKQLSRALLEVAQDRNDVRSDVATRAYKILKKGWQGRQNFHNVTNWRKRVAGGLRLKDKLDSIFAKKENHKVDTFNSKRAHFWGRAEKDPYVKGRFKVDFLNHGLTRKTLDVARTNLAAKHVDIKDADLSDLYQTVNLDEKVRSYANIHHQSLVGSLTVASLQDAGFDNDAHIELRGKIYDSVSEGKQAMEALNEHLNNAGAGGDQELRQIFDRLASSHRKMIEALTILDALGGPQTPHQERICEQMFQHAGLTHELAMSTMPLGSANYLNSRLAISDPLNYASSLYDIRINDEVSLPITPPQTLHKSARHENWMFRSVPHKSAVDWQGEINDAATSYNNDFEAVQVALKEFQAVPSDTRLARLLETTQRALSRNDRLRWRYMVATSRQRISDKNNFPSPERTTLKLQLGRLDAQRSVLQDLSRMANDTNEQRNSSQLLPNMHQIDKTWRGIRHADQAPLDGVDSDSNVDAPHVLNHRQWRRVSEDIYGPPMNSTPGGGGRSSVEEMEALYGKGVPTGGGPDINAGQGRHGSSHSNVSSHMDAHAGLNVNAEIFKPLKGPHLPLSHDDDNDAGNASGQPVNLFERISIRKDIADGFPVTRSASSSVSSKESSNEGGATTGANPHQASSQIKDEFSIRVNNPNNLDEISKSIDDNNDNNERNRNDPKPTNLSSSSIPDGNDQGQSGIRRFSEGPKAPRQAFANQLNDELSLQDDEFEVLSEDQFNEITPKDNEIKLSNSQADKLGVIAVDVRRLANELDKTPESVTEFLSTLSRAKSTRVADVQDLVRVAESARDAMHQLVLSQSDVSNLTLWTRLAELRNELTSL